METSRKSRTGRGLIDPHFTGENKLRHKDMCCWLQYSANYKQNQNQHPRLLTFCPLLFSLSWTALAQISSWTDLDSFDIRKQLEGHTGKEGSD